MEIDKILFFLINREMENRAFDLLMPFITSKAYLIALPFLILYLLREKKAALVIFSLSFFSILLSDGTSNLLKHLIGRERPCNVLEGVHLLVGCTGSFSMPSNHASNAFALVTPFLFARRLHILTSERAKKTAPFKYFLLLLAIFVCFSRVYVGVHYPFDVLVGAAVGTMASLIVMGLYIWSKERFLKRPFFTLMVLFLIGLSLFRVYYILLGPLDLSPDEAHYWEWSRRLDLSYYSKGPMIAYLIALGRALFGDNVFGVRFLAIIFSLLSSLYLYKLGRVMYDERIGALSAILFQIIPLYSAFGIIFTIDSPLLFFWIISLYLFWNALEGDKRSWPLVGLFVGLGLLTKYSMAFFYLCGFLFLLGERRGLLKRPEPYMAFIISLTVFLPVIIWNAQHDWVTFRHTAGQAHLGGNYRFDWSSSMKNLLEFVGSQLGILTPVLSVMIIASLIKMRKAVEGGRFLFWFSIPIIIFFTLKGIHAKVQANWAMTGYITGIIGLSVWFFRSVKGSIKKVTIGGIVFSLLLTALCHYPPGFLPVKLDPTSRLKGWKSLGMAVSDLYEGMEKEGKVFIFSDRYQVASELAFYVRGNPTTYCINLGRRMNQYDLWPKFDNLMHYNAIFVTIGRIELPSALRNGFDRCFARVFEAREHRRLIREYSLFSCYDFKGIKEEEIRSY